MTATSATLASTTMTTGGALVELSQQPNRRQYLAPTLRMLLPLIYVLKTTLWLSGVLWEGLSVPFFWVH
jgi:hypothetical protein